MARVSTLEVIVEGDATRLVSALNTGAKATQNFGGRVTATAKTTQSALGTIVPVSAAAAGLAIATFARRSVDAALQFDRSFTRIAAVTNTSSAAIEGMKDEVLTLAGETAQAPAALADSLYFLSSAGLEAAQVSEALEASARASAVGLGEAADVARLTANALNAYAGSGLDAAQVTDTLAAAVREGTAEPAEFADAMGRVLPIASKVGIEFDQVAASLATMSNAGLDVNEGVTALRGLLQSLAAPTEQTVEALGELGLTTDELRSVLAEDGLIAALRLLEERSGGNIDAMRELVPNVRALTGAFNLTGQEAEKVDGIFQRVLDSTGTLSSMMEETAESDAFKLKKALNDISIAGQQLAAAVLPVIADALSAIAPFVPVIVKLGVALAALKVASILTDFRALGALFGKLVPAARGATTALGAMRVALASLAKAGGALVVFEGISHIMRQTQTSIEEMAGATGVSVDRIREAEDRLNEAFGRGELENFLSLDWSTSKEAAEEVAAQWSEVEARLRAAGVATEDINAIWTENIGVLEADRDSIDDWRKAVEGASSDVLGWTGRQAMAAKMSKEAAAATRAQRAADKGLGQQLSLTTQQLARRIEKMYALRSAQLKLAGGLLGLIESARSYADAQEEVTRLEANGKRGTEAYTDAVGALLSERLQLEQQFIDFGTALAEEGASLAEARASLKGYGQDAGLAGSALQRFIQVGLAPVRDQVRELNGDLEELGRTDVSPTVRIQVLNERSLDSLQNKLRGLEVRYGSEFGGLDLGVNVHTRPASPWPDEALRLHLFDPLKAGGFVRGGDGWMLRADVGIHVANDAARFLRDTAIRRIEIVPAAEWNRREAAPEPRVPHIRFEPSRTPGLGASEDDRRVVVALDRRRFSDEMTYESVYRGW